MPTVYIPTPLRKYTNNRAQLTLPAGTLSALFVELDSACPGIKTQLCNDKGALKRYINIFVNGRDIRSLGVEPIVIGDHDEVYIIPAMAGG
jgi:sulfur-carrier protein